MAVHTGPETIDNLAPGDHVYFTGPNGHVYKYVLREGLKYMVNLEDYNRKVLDDAFGERNAFRYLESVYGAYGMLVGSGDWPVTQGGTDEQRLEAFKEIIRDIYAKFSGQAVTFRAPRVEAEKPKTTDWKEHKAEIEEALYNGEARGSVIGRFAEQCGYLNPSGRVITIDYNALATFVIETQQKIPQPPR